MTAIDLGGNDVTVNTIRSGSSAPAGSGAVILPAYEYINVVLTATSASQSVYVNPTLGGTYTVAGVSSVFGTASSSGTLQVEVATGTQAVGSGTNQLTGTIALSGTANTTANGTMITTPTTIAAGSRVNLIIAGTMTSLALCQVTIALQRIS